MRAEDKWCPPSAEQSEQLLRLARRDDLAQEEGASSELREVLLDLQL